MRCELSETFCLYLLLKEANDHNLCTCLGSQVCYDRSVILGDHSMLAFLAISKCTEQFY